MKIAAILVSMLIAVAAFAGKLDGKRVQRVKIKNDVYLDCTVHEARERYIHFTINGGLAIFISGLKPVETNTAFAGKEIVFSGEYEVEVATASR